MAKILEKYIEKLRAKGLFVSQPHRPTHKAFPDGVVIGKPIWIKGNSIPAYRTGYASLEPKWEVPCAAPMVRLYSVDGTWYVDAIDSSGGFRACDFLNEWKTPEEAVKDILPFYFGNPNRVNAKTDYKNHP
jgi:hypothetical protein